MKINELNKKDNFFIKNGYYEFPSFFDKQTCKNLLDQTIKTRNYKKIFLTQEEYKNKKKHSTIYSDMGEINDKGEHIILKENAILVRLPTKTKKVLKLIKEIKLKNFDKVFIFNSSLSLSYSTNLLDFW